MFDATLETIGFVCIVILAVTATLMWIMRKWEE
jgi:hypothetical protein